MAKRKGPAKQARASSHWLRSGSGGSRFDVLSRGLVRERGKMNATETEYAGLLKLDAQVCAWWFEPFSLRLSHPETGQPATYSPDFMVLHDDGTTFIDDVKSSGLDDPASIVRLKASAELYPLWRFRIAKKQRVRDGGGFKITEV